MPERPDYAVLIRGQASILDRINAGGAGLAALNELVQLAQDALGARGAVFAEYGPGHGRIIAASGACARALGRPVESGDARLGDGPRTHLVHLDATDDGYTGQPGAGGLDRKLAARCDIGGLVVGAVQVYYAADDDEPTDEHHAALALLASYVAHMYGDQAGLPVHGDGPVVAALSDGLAIVDRGGVVQLWNPAAEQLTGRSAAETLHRELAFPVPPPGQVLSHQLPDGRWLKVTSGDLPGTPALRVVTFRDSTDQARRHEDRELFVAVTSHELRTPVTVIKGYAETLTNHWASLDEPGRREAVRVIGARAGELARLVDRLLSATSDTGPVPGSPPGPFDLVETLRAAVGDLSAELRSRLVTDRLPADLPKAYGDRDSLATILTELATNADRYSPAGSAVELSADADEQTVTFRFADRGIGVRPEHVERVFDRYWQGESGDRGHSRGRAGPLPGTPDRRTPTRMGVAATPYRRRHGGGDPAAACLSAGRSRRRPRLGRREQASKNPRSAATDAAPKRQKIRDIFVARPFEGLTDEPEWIALRELVPAASAPLQLRPEIIEEYGDRPVTLSTVLPMAWPAMTRADGRVFIGLQRHVQSGDVSRDLAVAILAALGTEPGGTVAVPALPGEGQRLQDILVDGPLEITMHDTFEYWLDEAQADDPNVKASLERANASIYPTERLAAAPAAYWCRVPDKAHVRWVLPEPEDTALDALSRLSAGGELLLGDGTKFAGMFRAHGLLVPVWDVPGAPGAADWEAPLADLAKRYTDALADTTPLDAAARRSKQGLVGRQLTLR